MDEQDWKNIINELKEQLGQVSIERAVARADVLKAARIIDDLRAENERLQSDAVSIQPVATSKKE